MIIAAALFIWAFIYFMRREIKKHAISKLPRQRARPTVVIKAKEEPPCELCNNEDMYIGRSRIACPKCKRGAN